MSAVLLRRGDTGPAVAEIRDRLVRLGLIELTSESVDVFDDQLYFAVRLFQQERGLTVDGIVGPQTFRRLEESRWRFGDRVLAYRPGHLTHGEDISVLQQRLLELGFTLDRIDGIFGRQTDAAVREFQKNVGLEPDGICGPEVFKSFDRLQRTIAGGSQEHLRELVAWDSQHRSRPSEAFVILVDPSDSAKTIPGSDLTESQLCWDIATRLEGRLLASGNSVIFTHARDAAAPDERARAAQANDNKVDLVISLCLDESRSPKPHGVASYFFGHQFSRSATGVRLADLIQEEICAHTQLQDSHSHPKTWDLLRLTRMPAVRVELGYISNPDDCAELSRPEVRDAIAGALASAVTRIMAPRIG